MNLSSMFSYKIQQMMARYQATFNCASQALAVDSNKCDIQTTGGQIAYFDGHPVKLAADAALDISGESNESVTAWANNTAYSIANHLAPVIRSANLAEGNNVRFRCILTHTSNQLHDKPGEGSQWDKYWVREPHGAATAKAATVGAGNTRQYMVLANRAGVCSTALCGNDANSTVGFTLKIPQFDPHTYVPIGFVHIINAEPSNTFTIGTTDCDAANMTVTYHNLTTPVFPHPDNIDKR